MIYSVSLAKTAARFLLRLRDAKLKARIDKAIGDLAGDPRPLGSRMLSGSNDRYRVRIGDYPVIYRVDKPNLAIQVLLIGHRREIYELS